MLGGVGAFATFVVFAWRDHDEYVIPAAEVARIDGINRAARRAALSAAGSRVMTGAAHRLAVRIRIISLGGRPHEGPASKRIVTGYGFWIFLLSDIVMFSCFFAAYAVLLGQTAGGPKGPELFDLRSVAAETAFCCCRASPAGWP